MEQFVEQLSSPYFCITIIVIPLIVGIIGNYLPGIVGALFGRVSKTAKRWSDKSALEEWDATMYIVNDPNGFIHGAVAIFIPAVIALIILLLDILTIWAWFLYLYFGDLDLDPEVSKLSSWFLIYFYMIFSFYFFVRSRRKAKIYRAARVIKTKERAAEEKRKRDLDPF